MFCINFSQDTFCRYDDPWVAMIRAANRSAFEAFLERIMPSSTEPNPLPILARAINRVRRSHAIFQPRWKAGRWKAKT
jgi:hypothetical protein